MFARKRLGTTLLFVSGIITSTLAWYTYKTIQQYHLNDRLRYAIEAGNDKAVKTLLADGADPNCGSMGARMTVVEIIRRTWERKTVVPSFSTSLITTAVHNRALSQGKLGMVILRSLLDAGANVNARERGGFTPLIRATQDADPEAVQLLLNYGANVDARETSTGKTAMQWCSAPNERRTHSCARLDVIAALLRQTHVQR